MSFYKRNIIVGITLFTIISSPIIYENILRFKKGPSPLEPDPYDFAYNYVEIHKRFFRKSYSPKEGFIFKPQRSRCDSESFLARKEKGTRRIFVIGGSVARLFNRNVLENLLGNLAGGSKFEVIGCGIGGYDSYRESLVLNEIIHYSPDLIIVMSGNNEFFSPVDLNLFAYRFNKFFRGIWVYRLLQDKIVAKNNKSYRASVASILSNFRNNLIMMINKAEKHKVPIALCTLPVNFRDIPPTGLQPLQNKEYFEAWNSFNEGKFKEAEEKFKRYLIDYQENKFVIYFLAQCYDKRGDYYQAKNYYLRALDLDATPGDRCSLSRNAIIRKLSAKNDVILIDLEKAFTNFSKNGLLDREFFIDNCHWLDEYNFLVYNEIIQSIIQYSNTHPRQIFINPDRNNLQNTKKFLLKSSLKEKTKEALIKESFRWLLYAFTRSSDGFSNDNINERVVYPLKIAYELNSDLFEDKMFLKEQIIKEV